MAVQTHVFGVFTSYYRDIGKVFDNGNHEILISGPRINTAEGILLSGCGKVTVPWENPLSHVDITRNKLLQI